MSGFKNHSGAKSPHLATLTSEPINFSKPHNVHSNALIECKLRWYLLPCLLVTDISYLSQHQRSTLLKPMGEHGEVSTKRKMINSDKMVATPSLSQSSGAFTHAMQGPRHLLHLPTGISYQIRTARQGLIHVTDPQVLFQASASLGSSAKGDVLPEMAKQVKQVKLNQ